jgi:AbrB family looped-hinge helix DNA binding protein
MKSSVITTKGQIVIPKNIREKYKLKPGTKVYFEETETGVLLKHVSADFISKSRGIIPKTKNEKPISQWWQDYKNTENDLEERKLIF